MDTLEIVDAPLPSRTHRRKSIVTPEYAQPPIARPPIALLVMTIVLRRDAMRMSGR